MAEEIVSCPGCAKKFRIPEGAPGGTFQCTACDAAVPYGKAAAQPARAGAPAGRSGAAAKAAPSARAAAPVARAAKPEPRSGGRSSAGARGRSRGRRDEADDEPEERGHRARKKTNPAVLFGSIGGILLVGVVVAIAAGRKNDDTLPATLPPQNAPTTPPAQAPAAAPAAAPSPAAGAPAAEPGATDKPGEASGIGGAQQSPGKGSYSAYLHLPGDQLFVRQPDLPGTTESERTALDKDAAAFADRNSGKAGTDARTRLRKAGKKSIPSLVSVYEQHWKGTKWASDDERFASYQIQKLLAEIVKADRPGGDFFATFGPGVSVPTADFERAAKMWTAWWLGQGQSIEKFKDFPE